MCPPSEIQKGSVCFKPSLCQVSSEQKRPKNVKCRPCSIQKLGKLWGRDFQMLFSTEVPNFQISLKIEDWTKNKTQQPSPSDSNPNLPSPARPPSGTLASLTVTPRSVPPQLTNDQTSPTNRQALLPLPCLFPRLCPWAQAEKTLGVVLSRYGGRGQTGAVA